MWRWFVFGMKMRSMSVLEKMSDEAVARALIAGHIPLAEGFRMIMASEGFPVHTAHGTCIFLFKGPRGCKVATEFDGSHLHAMKRGPGGLNYAEVWMPAQVGHKLRYGYLLPHGKRVCDPLARCFLYEKGEEVSLLRRPEGMQHLMRWDDFESPQGLKSRSIHVLVPPNAGPYDVLYAHDGQNLFSPQGICGGWRLCENMRRIGGDFLIVGIWNTPDRLREYTHVSDEFGDGMQESLGRKYASFVEETLRPFIERTFDTTGRAGLMGSSLGGLISLYIASCYPGRYDSVFALSPTTAWGRFSDDHGRTIRDVYERAGHQNTFIYIDHGGIFPAEGMPDVLDRKVALRDEAGWGSEYDNSCYTFDFVSALVELGYRQSVDLFYEYIPGALHNEDAWASRVSHPLRLFMKRHRASDSKS